MCSLYVVTLLLLWVSALVNCQNVSNSEDEITFSLTAGWSKTPFKLNVLEAVSHIDDSLYELLVLKLLGIEYDVENEEYNIIEDFNELDDTEFYTFAKDLLKSDSKRFMADMGIANVLLSPRIQAHFNYYNTQIKPKHKCDQDAVIFEPVGTNVYCDKDAAFMLQNHDREMFFREHSLSFDRMLGSQVTAKAYFIYGDFRDEYFRIMFFNMYQFVHSGKINLIWRYVDTHPSIDQEILSGYSIDIVAEKQYNYTSKDIRQHMVKQFLESDSSILSNILSNEWQNYIDTGVLGTEPDYTLATLEHGIYINDAKIDDFDFLSLIETIGNKIAAQEVIRKAGISLVDSLKSIKAFKDTFIANNKRFEQRYAIFESPAVTFLNNIEEDTRYSDLKVTDSVYRESFVTGKIPNMKQNIHQVIFIIDITQPSQIGKLLEFYDLVFDNLLPIQVGVIPIVDLERRGNEEGIDKLYGTREELGYTKIHSYLLMLQRLLYSYEQVFEKIFDEIMFPDASKELSNIMIHELKQLHECYGLGIDHPQINVNGIFYDLDDAKSVLEQIEKDSSFLHDCLVGDKIPHTVNLKTYLRKDSVSLRDNNVFPSNIEVFEYQILPPPDLEEFNEWIRNGSINITGPQNAHGAPITFNLIGSFQNMNFVKQMKEALDFAKTCSDIKLTIYDTSFSEEFKHMKTISHIEELINHLEKRNIEEWITNERVSQNLKPFGINDGYLKSFIVISGRKIQLSSVLTANQLTSLVQYERTHRLHQLWQLYQAYRSTSNEDDVFINFELFSWAITYSSFLSKDKDSTPNSLLDKRGDVFMGSDTKLINIKLVTDLVSEKAQSLLHVAEMMKVQTFVGIDIYVLPATSCEDSLRRSKQFVNTDPLVPNSFIKFQNIPKLFNVEFKAPSSWIVSSVHSNSNHIAYELQNIVADVYLRDTDGSPMVNIPIKLKDSADAYYSIPEAGYIQLKTNPGLWNVEIEYGTDADILYDLEENAVQTIGFERNIQNINLVKKKHLVDIGFSSLQINAPILEKLYFKAQRLLHRKKEPKTADVNIFTVPKEVQEEERMLAMIVSVMKHTKSAVKFWIYEGFISAASKTRVEILSEKYGFEFKYVNYQWPNWLSKPQDKEQQVWGIQTLFLDALFPSSIETIIIISTNQILTGDVIDLLERPIGLPFIAALDSFQGIDADTNTKQMLKSHKGVYLDGISISNLVTFRQNNMGALLRNNFNIFLSSGELSKTFIVNLKQIYDEMGGPTFSLLWSSCISEIETIKQSEFSNAVEERQNLMEEIYAILDPFGLEEVVMNHDEL